MNRRNDTPKDYINGSANQRRNQKTFNGKSYGSQQMNSNVVNERHRVANTYRNISNDRNNKLFYGNNGHKTDNTYRNKKSRVMGYKRLEEIIAKYSENPIDLLLNLKCDSFFNLITDNDKLEGKFGDYQFLCNIFQALSLISHCHRDILKPFYVEINAKDFEFPIIKYLINFMVFVNPYNKRNIELHKKAFENFVDFLRSFQILLQKLSVKKVSLILIHLKEIVKKCNKREQTLSQKSVQLIELIDGENERINTLIDDLELTQPLDVIKNRNDFREISIFPTTQDIHSFHKPFIRKNIIKGKFDSINDYLDVQFRLLREDYVRPLREGINEYLEKLKENKPIKRLNDIRIYTNVNIIGSEFRNGLIYTAKFDNKNFKHIRWQNSKLLIYGSILCLTSNDFKTFCFATVAGKRDPKLLAKGVFQLEFVTQLMSEEMIEFTSSTLIMAEAQAYFEAYRHNLLALQLFKSDEFPLQNYIINVSTDIKNLSHLTYYTTYDLSDLALSLGKIDKEMMESIIKSLTQSDFYNKNLTFIDKIEPHLKEKNQLKQNQLKNVCVSKDLLWPKASVLGVDDSQYEAIKAALTKELVIIQGPPGTGKTYVGLRIVQILLRNRIIWNTRSSHSPILVVCYTNHALDQFLEGMVPFCKIINGIVRIGGRCQSDILDRYTLTNLRRQMQTTHNVPQHIYTALKDTRRQLEMIQMELSSLQNDVQLSRTRILGNKLNKIVQQMSPTYKMQVFIQQLMIGHENFESALIKWLSSKVVLKKFWVDIEELNEWNNFGSNNELHEYRKVVRLKLRIKREYSSELSSNDVMSNEEGMSFSDITQMSNIDRWRLYRLWRQLYCVSKQKEIHRLVEKYNEKNQYLLKLKAFYSDHKEVNAQYKNSMYEKKLEEDYKQIDSERLLLLDSKKDLLGSQLKNTIEKFYSNSHIIQQLFDLYDNNFELALFKWLSNRVVLKEVWVEVENTDNSELNETNDLETIDVTNNSHNDSESEEELEEEEEDGVDEEEVQNMLDIRIIEDELNYGNLGNQSRNHLNKARDNDSFCFNGSKKQRYKFEKEMKHELSSNNVMSYEEIMRINDINQLSNSNRWRLYRVWRKLYFQEKEIQIKALNEEYAEKLKEFERIRLEEDLYILREADIVGLTTTGAAKFRSIIEQIDPLIVVVEEAAEVLESHVVTSLTKSTKHLILIGDHQQLKPNPTVYDLAINYNLEVSLFERMINNDLPFYQLKTQHRMRPSISSLLVPHIYKELIDHESVQKYEQIKGISKSMFFINHNHKESQTTNDNKSKKNEFEAEFIVSLCKYLILQEYKPSQIAVLTMYSSQLFLIKQLMKKQEVLNGVRATVLDNYQGEESDIILLSFVRSNNGGGIGFLKVPNRVNVALSRARMGMYCIGNFDCLSKQSQLWYEIKKSLIKTDEIGSTLELYCQNHPKNKTLVSKSSDFQHVPEGGCDEPCGRTLRCGHICPRICHVYDKEHETVVCKEKCKQIACELGHRCEDKCHYPDKCKPCAVLVNKIIPLCKHEIRIKCSSDPSKAFCQKPCDKSLSCGHPCTQMCGKDCKSKLCTAIVEVYSLCGHRVEIECGKQTDVKTQLKNCTEKCDSLLDCGHRCQGSCGQCHQKRLHTFCRSKCERKLSCNHLCKELCGKYCEECKKCKNRANFEENQKIRDHLIKRIDEFIEEQNNKLRNNTSNYNIMVLIVLRKVNNLKMSAKKRYIKKAELLLLSKKFEIFEQIAQYKQLIIDLKHLQTQRQDFPQILDHINCFDSRIDDLLQFIDQTLSNNRQQLSDVHKEMNRFEVMSETLLLIIENQFYDEGKQLLIEAFDLLSTLMPFNEYIELKFRLLVNYAEKYKHLKQLELISEHTPSYLLIKEYFDNSRAHTGVNISLKSIHRYNNLESKKSFENNFSKDRRMLLWHGTKQRSLDSIFAEGLKLPKHGGMFGKGIYFADRVTKSVYYTDYKIGVGTLLLCEVAVGDMFGRGDAFHYTEPPPGYHSVKGIGKHCADPKEERIIENKLSVPLGKTIPNIYAINSRLEYNEHIIYDPKRVLIRYVVEV